MSRQQKTAFCGGLAIKGPLWGMPSEKVQLSLSQVTTDVSPSDHLFLYRTPLETPEPLETVTPKKEAECIDGNVKDKPFPSGGEVKQQHSCKIDKKFV